MHRIITLITDFGLADEYVGVMKGVILTRAPEATIVDISHAIPRQNILQAALLLKSAYGFFPKGTVHLIVVDPGVGSDRKLILLQADGHLILAPDNGVLSLVLDAECFEAAFEVQCKQLYLSPVSSSFHGRDVLAPVAAQLIAGLDPAEVGPVVIRRSLNKLEITQAIIDTRQGKIAGEIIAVDYFGNLQTNIGENSLKGLQTDENMTVKVTVKNKTIFGIKSAYSQIAPGGLLAIIGSRGFLEITVNQGSAASFLNAGVGDSLEVEMIKA
jgi:S-adenosylmethionine hydrolase